GEDLSAALVDHPAPRRCRRRDAEAEKAERRLEEDHVPDAQGRDDEDRRERVREQVTKDDSRRARSEPARREKPVALHQREKLPAHETRDIHPGEEPDHRDDEPDRAVLEKADAGDDEKDGRKAEEGVEDSHDEAVEEAARVAREGSDENA